MSQDHERLSRIETLWSVIRRAHQGSEETVHAAQQTLLDRYGGAARRYLLGALRDQDAADDLFQEFALRFVRGDFHQADPRRGRFRDFVRTALRHLIVDYHRQRGDPRRPQRLDHGREPAAATADVIDDDTFHASWRQELLEHCWRELAALEQQTGTPLCSALRLRTEQPELDSLELAARLSTGRRQPLTGGNVRVLVHRARQFFSDRLIDAVGESLEEATFDEIESELIELRLRDYCRRALDRRRSRASRTANGAPS